MIYAPLAEQCAIYDISHNTAETEYKTLVPTDMSSFTWPLREFSVGSTAYRFFRTVQRCEIPSEGGYVSYIRQLPNYTGKGQTAEKAFEDLKVNIHVDFQRLLRMRPFEMGEEEKSKWSSLASVVDLLEYKITTPLIVREIGQISYGKISRPQRIKWIRDENYFIDPTKVPGELMACAPGQWIEAVVKRDPVSHRILEIESIGKIKFRIPRESEIKEIWESMPKKDLESDDWTW
jgi:hypothetical protein